MDTSRNSTSEPAPSRLIQPGLRAFFRICDKWGLDTDQRIILLGSPERTLYDQWLEGIVDTVPPHTIERLSYILGIYKALHTLFPDNAFADRWIHQPNKAQLFGGKPALDRLLTGRVDDLAIVRKYLDAACG